MTISITSITTNSYATTEIKGAENSSKYGYQSAFEGGTLRADLASQSTSILSISPAAKLANEIDALDQKLTAFQKAVESGDLTLSAKALVELKQEILNFKTAVKNMQMSLELMAELMNMLDEMTEKMDNIASKSRS